MNRIAAAWIATMEALADLAESLRPDEWRLPTDLPGWDVKDNISHVSGLEAVILGWPQPEHVLPEGLTHIRDDLGRFMEGPVDVRRAWPNADVVAELRRVIETRRAAFAELTPAADDQVPGPTGRLSSAAGVFGTRTFDCWAHEQDVRRATGHEGNLDSDAALISYARIVSALPFILGRSGAPVGTSLLVDVSGPVPFRAAACVGGSETVAVEESTLDAPTVVLTMDDRTIACLTCGRIDPGTAPVVVTGDAAIAAQVLASFAITP